MNITNYYHKTKCVHDFIRKCDFTIKIFYLQFREKKESLTGKIPKKLGFYMLLLKCKCICYYFSVKRMKYGEVMFEYICFVQIRNQIT